MGQAGLTGSICAALALSGGLAWAAGPSRFASYSTEADCVAARSFAPALCRTAFANARSEYEAKTPSFTSQALCARRYASCMAWPGAGGAAYRPAWDGVDIVDTPTEHSVTPSPGATGRALRFAARPLGDEAAPLVIRRAALPVPATGGPRPPGPALARGPAQKDPPPSAVPPSGSGFKLEDGVLTYPAPARYQPKNLPKP